MSESLAQMFRFSRKSCGLGIAGLILFLLCFWSCFSDGFEARKFFYSPGFILPEMSLNWSAEQVELANHGADLSSYILLAFNHESSNFWPPGMPTVLMVLFKLFGTDHYILKMLVVAAIVWGLGLTLIYRKVRSIFTNDWLGLLFVCLLFFMPGVRSWAFGIGVIMSESFSHLFFLVSLAYFFDGVRTGVRKNYLWFGFFLALAAYFRAYFEMLSVMLLGFVLLAMFVEYILKKIKRVKLSHPTLLSILLGLLLCQGLLLPWRVHNHDKYHSYSWLPLDEKYMWQWTFKYDEQQPSFHKSGNAACHADPEVCRVVHDNFDSLSGSTLKNLTMATVIFHPLRYYAYKILHFPFFWVGIDGWGEAITQYPGYALEGFILILLCVAAAIYSLCKVKLKAELWLFLLFTLVFVFINVLVFTFFNYEWRYSFALRLYCLYSPVWMWMACSGSDRLGYVKE